MSAENNSTGIVLEWEPLAMRGEEMPVGLAYPDQVLFQALSLLYTRYRMETITRKQAQKEKLKLLEEYRCYQERERLVDDIADIIKRTELARAEYRKNRTVENADKVMDILDGRKRPVCTMDAGV